MKFLKNTLFFLLSVILAVNILLFQVLFLTNQKVVRPQFYISKFEEFQLYDDLEYYLTQNIKDLISNEEISEKLAEGVVERDWISSEINVLLTGMLSYLTGKTDVLPVVNYDPVINRLTDNINGIIKEIGIKNNLIENMIISSVEQNIDTALPLAPFSSSWDELKQEKFVSSLEKPRLVFSNINTALYISAGLMLVSLLFLLILGHKGSIYLKYLGASALIGGAMTSILSLFGLSSSGSFIQSLVQKGMIPPDILQYMPALNMVTVSIIKGLAYPLLIGGVGVTAVGAILMIVFSKKFKGTQ